MNPYKLCTAIGKTLPRMFECSPAPREGVRVRTPMMYPDGGVVDVFVLERGGQFVVTDFGDALGWLRTQSTSDRRSPKQQLLVEDVCQTLGVELSNGQLILRSGNDKPLGETVLLLAQAVVRVSDLWFTFRSSALQSTADEVDQWLRDKRIPFKHSVRHAGRSSRNWTIDFQVIADQRTSMVFLLSTGSRAAVRRITDHVVAGCMDLSHLKEDQPHLAFVSLFDDTQDVWRDEDFDLVEQQSIVARWSRPDVFERILRPPDIGSFSLRYQD